MPHLSGDNATASSVMVAVTKNNAGIFIEAAVINDYYGKR
jgi:hypothetical protein